MKWISFYYIQYFSYFSPGSQFQGGFSGNNSSHYTNHSSNFRNQGHSRRHSQSATITRPPPTFLVTNCYRDRNRMQHRNSLGMMTSASSSTTTQGNRSADFVLQKENQQHLNQQQSRSLDGHRLSIGSTTYLEPDDSRRHSVSSCTRLHSKYFLLLIDYYIERRYKYPFEVLIFRQSWLGYGCLIVKAMAV